MNNPVGGTLFLLQDVLDLAAVESPDFFSQIVDQFEEGQRLLRRPCGGYDDRGCPARFGCWRRRRLCGLAYALPPRR
jgi:hypothetical protein